MRSAAVWAVGLLLWAAPVGAQELRIGMKGAVDSAHPHLLFTPNRDLDLHLYEPLLMQDAEMRPQAALAQSWRATAPDIWELSLRPDAVFSDGTKLTAADVVFSIRRAQTIEGLRTYRAYLRDIVSIEAVDPQTVRLRTQAPVAQLPFNLTTIGMVSAKAAKDAAAEDFNGGRAAVGTGPYRWVKWTPGQDVVLERNPDYRGAAEPWSRVIFRFIPNDSARVAALLSGDVDVIDAVPASLYPRVSDDRRTRLQTATSVFMLYIALDRRERSPFVTGPDGQVLARNPLNDPRVRQAMDHALNRTGIAERAMENGAVPASQFMPTGFNGNDPDLKPASYDPGLARRLLADAGFPQGFGLTLHCMNDRFPGDAQTCQTVAQMLTAVGIRTKVEAMPAAMFFRRARGMDGDSEFSAFMVGFGTASGLATSALSTNLMTRDPATGRGASNDSRYSNPELDKLVTQAEATFDETARTALIRQATRLAMEDQAILPIFHMKAAWGLRRDLSMPVRGDGYTFATTIRVTP